MKASDIARFAIGQDCLIRVESTWLPGVYLGMEGLMVSARVGGSYVLVQPWCIDLTATQKRVLKDGKAS